MKIIGVCYVDVDEFAPVEYDKMSVFPLTADYRPEVMQCMLWFCFFVI